MKKVIALLLVVAMTAAISIGATLAYLTDTDEDVNVMTVGQVKIDQLEYERIDTETKDEKAEVQEFHDNKPLYPAVTEEGFTYIPGTSYVDWEQIGKEDYTSPIWDPSKINNEVDKMVFVKNKGDWDAYVRTVFAFEAGKYTNLTDYLKDVHLNLNETDWTWKWVEEPVTIGGSKYFIATATYNDVLKPGQLTEISLSQIALDSSVTNEDVAGFGDTYQVLVQSQAVQVAGFTDADTALNEAFGKVGSDATPPTPFPNDNPAKGIDLRTALHYYEGGSTQITGNVTNVIFGLTGDYAAVAENRTGTLVDVEQDVPVYAYYVPSSTGYDVYFLANDTIYAPANSNGLFANMTQLKTVDTDNFDVSRATDMTSLFDYCGALETVDTTDWDTSNVTGLSYAFYGCQALKELDVSGWDTAKVTNMKSTFFNCLGLTELDVSGWKTGNVENFNQMFCRCKALTTLDVSGWDTGKANDMTYLFYECFALNGLNVSGWNTGNVTRMKGTFARCYSLSALDVSKWDTSNVTTMYQMFYGDTKLGYLDVSQWNVSEVTDFAYMFSSEEQNLGDMKLTNLNLSNWNPASATNMCSMIYGCGSLTSLDLSGWNMPNLTNVSHMMADCFNLETIDVSGWKTPALTTMDGMFNDCRKVKMLDMSSFDTSKVKEFSQIFEACYALEEIKGLEKWNTANGQDFSELFSGCSSLKELNLSSFNTSNANSKYYTGGNYENWMFLRFMSGCTKLEKVTFGANFDFDGIGNCPEDYKFVMESASGVEGWDGKWYNAETGVGYLPTEIPEKTAATYVAVKP